MSPTGRDDAPGTAEQPLATLTGARDTLRKLRAADKLGGEPVRVLFATGEYSLAGPVVFEAQDSGRAEAPVIFEAAEGAQPLFTGGRRIRGFKPIADGLWQAEVPEVRDGRWNFEQLYVNGVRAIRARTPNDDPFLASGVATDPIPGIPLGGPLDKTALVMPAEAVASLAGLSPEELHEVNAVIYHSWNVSRHRVAGVNTQTGLLQFTGPARWSFFQSEPYHRVRLENYRAALDAPGEWYVDRTAGLLLYHPRRGENMLQAEAIAPATPHWLLLKGDAEGGRLVEHVQFRGLWFADSQFLLGEAGWTDAQADAGLGAAIEIDGARAIRFEDCEFSRTGNYVVWFRHGCRDARVTRCRLHEMGAGGIKIGETSVPKTEAGQTSHIAIENNIIQGGGRYFPGAIGVWVGHSGDNAIVHNDIADFTYTAISLGWVWGFKPSLAARNRVEWNHLHHLGWGELSDLGAVYTLGPSPGTVVRHNLVHDIACYSYGGWGLYPDEGSSDIVFENNLVYRTESGGFHQHYGRENLVRNNIFADAREMQLRHSRTEDHLAFTFSGNIVLWKEGKLLGHTNAAWLGGQVKLNRNLYWQSEGEAFDFAGKSREEWQGSGQDTESVFADPLFVDAEAGDFDLKPDSPATRIGFQPWPYAQAGVQGEAWRQIAAGRTYPPMDFSPLKLDPPPLQLRESFEHSKLGPNFHVLKMNAGGRAEAAVITNEVASQGRQCLRIADSPDLQPAYNPHFYYLPRHKMGVTRVAFDLRVEAEADVLLEWRNVAGSPYRTGPSLRVKAGVLSIPGRRLLDVPPLQWVRIAMEAQLGGHAPGTWSLTVTMPDGTTQQFEELKFVHNEAKSLEWLGWISPSAAAGTYWIDQIEISNHVAK